MKTTVSLKYLVTDCLWKPLFDSNLLRTPWHLIPLSIFVTLKPLLLFELIITAIKLQKGVKISLT